MSSCCGGGCNETFRSDEAESNKVKMSHVYALKLGLEEVSKGTRPDGAWVSSMKDALDVYEKYLSGADDTLRYP